MNGPATEQLLKQGRYRLESQFRVYSGNVVFQAYDTEKNREVIIKELAASSIKILTATQQEALNKEFHEQMKAMTDIKHDSLLNIDDYFSEIGRRFIVMEISEATDLFKRIEQNKGPFSYKQVALWANQVLNGLSVLHSQDPPVIHNRIWPKNILIDKDGQAKLIGHGINEEINTSIENEEQNSTLLNFSPLEQLWWNLDPASQKVIAHSFDEQSEKILMLPADVRTDLYFVGATIYFLLTAKLPIGALERSIDILDGKRDPLTPPEKINAAISERISDVVLKAMEIKREDRYESVAAMQQALKTAISRVEEFELDNDKEQEEAAADLRRAAELKNEQLNMLLEQKKKEFEAEQRRQAALLEQKLLEAETQRILAEQRALEAELLLKEKEEETAKLVAAQVHRSLPPEEDLLGISDAPNPISLTAKNELSQPAIIHDPQLSHADDAVIETSFSRASSGAGSPYISNESNDLVNEQAVDDKEHTVNAFTDSGSDREAKGNVAYASFADLSDNTGNSLPDIQIGEQFENSGFGKTKMMAAAAVVLILILSVAGGVWLMRSPSSSAAGQEPLSETNIVNTPEQNLTDEPVVVEPVQEQTTAEAEKTEEKTAATEPTVVAENPVVDRRQTAVQTQPQNQRKPAPAKPQETKKVTVDDLINDL